MSRPEYVADAYGRALIEFGGPREDLLVLGADLSADCRLREFETKYPDRFIENGIAEQDMVSMAGGLALQGLLPVVNTFAAFLSSRANEQIYTNACEGTPHHLCVPLFRRYSRRPWPVSSEYPGYFIVRSAPEF